MLIGAARSSENPSIGLHVLEADLRDSDAVQTIARMVTRDLGTPDCLVNCEDPRGRWQMSIAEVAALALRDPTSVRYGITGAR